MTITTIQMVQSLTARSVTNMIEFLLPAFLGGWILCTVTGPLGCFIVWRRMAYFGDTLAHSALLGLTLGLLLDVRPSFAITFGCVGIALLLVLLQQQKQIATDTLLGILAHSGLSIGLITLSFYRDGNFDLMTFLFGDLLTLGWNEALWMLGGSAGCSDVVGLDLVGLASGHPA
jgi:zinc transport system permease protein